MLLALSVYLYAYTLAQYHYGKLYIMVCRPFITHHVARGQHEPIICRLSYILFELIDLSNSAQLYNAQLNCVQLNMTK